MSLRARLLAGLLVLAAAGLVTLGAVTYAEQRSFLYQRADQQASDVRDLVSRKLDQTGANVSGFPTTGDDHFGGRGGNGPPPRALAGYAAGSRWC
jgi:hypothetical protein